MLDIKSDEMLYAYRVYTVGGQALQAWVPYKSLLEFWEAIRVARANKKDPGVLSYGLRNNNTYFPSILDSKLVTAVDECFALGSRTLDQNDASLKAERTKNTQKKQKKNKITVGQTVKKIRN